MHLHPEVTAALILAVATILAALIGSYAAAHGPSRVSRYGHGSGQSAGLGAGACRTGRGCPCCSQAVAGGGRGRPGDGGRALRGRPR
jgi:hypothetical protein